jgi:hypothetical protein
VTVQEGREKHAPNVVQLVDGVVLEEGVCGHFPVPCCPGLSASGEMECRANGPLRSSLIVITKA